MSPETSESALIEPFGDEVTVCHRNPPDSRSASKASVTSVDKAVNASKRTGVQLSEGVNRTAKKATRGAHKTAKVATRGAHKTAKVTKAGIEKSVHAGRSICLRYPRIFSLIYGVLLPLWLIIFISLGFGYFLSLVEAPREVRANDSFLAAREEIRMISWLASNYTRSLPLLCFEEYLRIKANLTQDTDINIQTQIANAFRADGAALMDETRAIPANGTEINSAEIKSFMTRCGRIASPASQEFLTRAVRTSRELDGELSFDWMRCYEGASGVSSKTVKIGKQRRVAHRISEVRYAAQHEFYEQQWEKDREEKYNELVEEYMTNDNMPLEMAQSKALWEAAMRATGGDACGFNSAASAFFFFTIMTTVGYGNQSPSTVIGRGLILSFGFVAILLFGLILARAGRVVSAIFDDFLGRVHPAFITRPWASLLFWTGAYWGWMVAQAELYMRWREGRTGEPLDFRDSFWFAFLTSTTVGLGDFYVDPEVIIISDLLWIPAVILVGFVFFSAFLTKMIDVMNMFRPSGEGKTLIDQMLDQLISKDNPEGEPTYFNEAESSDSSTDSQEKLKSDADSARQNESRTGFDAFDDTSTNEGHEDNGGGV